MKRLHEEVTVAADGIWIQIWIPDGPPWQTPAQDSGGNNPDPQIRHLLQLGSPVETRPKVVSERIGHQMPSAISIP